MNNKSADGLGTQLRRLLELLDGDLEAIYRQDGFGFRPRYTPVMKALSNQPDRTIKQIAVLSSISHSAASQTVSKMAVAGLIEQKVGKDSRERLINLTKHGRELLPLLESRWQATQRAADHLDTELSAPLSQVLAEAILLLTDRPFATRIAEHEDSSSRVQT